MKSYEKVMGIDISKKNYTSVFLMEQSIGNTR